MTMPDERMRSLVQTREFLHELTQASLTPGVVKAIRTQANRLLRHYPLLMELDLLARRCPAVLAPPQQPAALADLLEQIPPENRYPLELEGDHGARDYQRLLMNLAAVRLLEHDPGLVERAMTTLARWRETADPLGRSLLDEWRGILDERDWSLVLERSERGKRLRQGSPLFTLLPNETREAITQHVKALGDASEVEFEPARVGALYRPAQFDIEPASDAVLRLRQAQAGQVVSDRALDKALGARVGTGWETFFDDPRRAPSSFLVDGTSAEHEAISHAEPEPRRVGALPEPGVELTPDEIAHNAAMEGVRNSDERLDRMLLSVRQATQANTMDRMVLVGYLEKFMGRHDIRVLGDTP